jgi:glutamyl-tRNA reductase
MGCTKSLHEPFNGLLRDRGGVLIEKGPAIMHATHAIDKASGYGDRQTKPSVGFIGMGHVGSGMARRLLDAGYPLTIFDRTTAHTEPLAQQGASVAHTPKDLAARCEVVLVCVTGDAAQQQVTFAPTARWPGCGMGRSSLI